MKRVTVLVDDIAADPDNDGDLKVTWPLGTRGTPPTWLPASRVVSVEDYVEPLPTEPGTRFWGSTSSTPPGWWFTMRAACGPAYTDTTGRVITDDRAAENGLTVLPEPEVTP